MKTHIQKFQAIKGVRDILPPHSELWNRVEQTAREVFGTYGYGEIRLPIFERSELFARSIGAETDIVNKEMYVFEEQGGGSLLNAKDNVMDAIYQSEDEASLDVILRFSGDFVRSLELAMTTGDLKLTEDGKERVDKFKEIVSHLTLLKDQPRTPGIWKDIDHHVSSLRVFIRLVPTGGSLALRPEGTASAVRAYIEHGMKTWPQPVKLYYMGPMFRREKPQKGRHRQFYQIGAEIFSELAPPSIDAEGIEMLVTFFRRVGLKGFNLYINSIGCADCRQAYVELLRRELRKVRQKLGPDSQRRIETNPLRVLDSKLPEEQSIIEGLPHISEHLCDACTEHHLELKHQLKIRGVVYEENWRLVRGLDYYMRTTFEITASGLGSQDAICGGGRYDGLVELLGGPPTKGFGFAIGTDRLVLSLSEAVSEVVSGREKPRVSVIPVQTPEIMVAAASEQTWDQAIELTTSLRRRGLSVFLPKSGTKLPRAFEAAQRFGIRAAILVGDNEVKERKFTIRILRSLLQNEPRDVEIENRNVVLYGKVVKLRQDLERVVQRLIKDDGELTTQGGISRLVDQLIEMQILQPQTATAIKDVLPILNGAIHGKSLTDGSIERALAFGNLLLNEIENVGPLGS